MRVRYICDLHRHLICLPYGTDELHRMARKLRIGRHFFHGGTFPHYDIPAKRVTEVTAKCEIVSPRMIYRIIRNALETKGG